MIFQLVESYHKLIDFEYEKYKKTGNLAEAKFTEDEAIKILSKISSNPKAILEELIKRGFIINLGDSYRTLHFDIAYRAANIRIKYETARYPLEAKVILDDEPLPEWEDHNFEDLKDIVNDDKVYSTLAYALYAAGYNGLGGGDIKGFSDFQWSSIKAILNEPKRVFVLSAPTSAGKTYAFLIPLLIKIIKGKIKDKPSRILLIYPRKSLERDQLNKLISILHKINEFLKIFLKINSAITIGIDDGETPRTRDVISGEHFRGVTCPRKGCEDSPLEYSKTNKGIRIRCRRCGYNYDWILGTKEQVWGSKPDILITNVWTLDWRLPSKVIQYDYKLYEGVEYIVMDEAHAYQSLLGGNVRYLLKRLKNSTNTEPKIILASATLPNPNKFAMELLDVDKQDIAVISTENVGRRKKKVLYLIMGIHPKKSWETVAYELALLLGTVFYFRNIQSIIFIDSIKSINRIYYSYLKVAVEMYNEPKDHLSKNVVSNPDDPYAFWVYGDEKIDSNTPKEIFNKIQIHHASVEDRETIEKEFVRGRYGVLLATSTLELGVDYPNVGIIMNIGVPFRSESLPQRVGRAGRNPERTLNTVLAIIILRNTPLEMYYIYQPEELIYGFKNIEIPISWKNIAVKRYHVLSMLLDEMGRDGKSTYILSEDGQPENLKSFILDIGEKLQNRDVLEKIKRTILGHEQAEELIKSVVKNAEKLSKSLEEIKKYKAYSSEVNEILWELSSYLRTLKEFAEKNKIKEYLDKINEIKNLCEKYGVKINGI